MPLSEIRLDGLWEEAIRTFTGLEAKVAGAVKKAIMQEAQDLRKRIVLQFRSGHPIGGSWKPLSSWTLASRKAQGFGGTKILVRTGDLRNSINVQTSGDTIFVGVSRTAQSKSGKKKTQATNKAAEKPHGRTRNDGGKDRRFKKKPEKSAGGGGKQLALVNLGEIHEFGAEAKVTVTRKMQRYVLGVLGKKHGGGGGGGGGGKFKIGAVITIKIPARPFIAPAVEGYDFERAIAVKVAVILEKGKANLGKP